MERDRDGGERRAGAGQRVRIEALVAVGETSGGGFEAESIDMSPEGMRLRTAYLPRVGDALICRFDGLGKELVVEGEVCWRAEQARGGEFGLRFTGLDAEAEEAVRAMCSSMDAGAVGAAGSAPTLAVPSGAAQRGARVRLHIDGLGSPMKARVRAGGLDDLEVGSNLEFLKVGRSLELEEVEQGTRREAYIDHVKVEVDPATSVPQLVVTLRYEAPRAARASRPRASSETLPPARPAAALDAENVRAPARPPSVPPPGEGARASSAPSGERAPARASSAPAGEGARASSAPPRDPQGERAASRPSVAPPRDPQTERASASASASGGGSDAAVEGEDDHDGDLSPAHSARAADAAPASAQDAAPASAREASEEAGAAPAADAQPSRLRDVGEKAAMAGKAVAGKIAPAIAGAGARAATAMAGMVARIKARRAARAAGEGDGSKEGGPRRKTAPPPAGALKSGGRRLVREEADEAAGEGTEPPRFNKKAAAAGSFLGLAAVLVVFGAARLLGLSGGDAPPAGAAETAAGAPALPASSGAPALPAAAATAAAPGGVLTANVPLFGATPLSTTEPVPPTPPADPSAEAGDPLARAASVPGGPGEDDEAEADEDEQEGPKEWGQGSVRNPTVLKLKMDGPIEELNGAAGAMGFTVSLPDRRALSSGSGLARKDKRIASVRVVNTPHGAEITLQFKDGVPAYKAKARGDRLEIALGRDEPKKVASKSKKKDDDKKKKGEKGSDKKDKER
ncbi:PilZ domain-containing protein [Sorangium sp. So ce1078]|uniref:PilZ domain-containing protein n=1 Tax=Sorangium sp. So ce1078 TaxID=3133329 RepID=UPI003F5E4BC4